MKASNYVQIQGWMISDLGLKGNSLFAYALIYGFSQDGTSQFTGSLRYVCRWLNCSRGTAIKVLKDLTNQKLLIKEQVTINNVTYNKYSAKLHNTGSAEIVPPVQKQDKGSIEVGVQGSSETVPNNTIINNTTNKGFSEKDFLNDWNKNRKKHLNKNSYLNKLSRDENEFFNDLTTDYSRDDIQCALIGLFKQKKMPNGNTSMQSNPKHFLTHFNAYLTAYHDKNSSLYGHDKQEIF
jgi:hypothetical protein